MRTITLEELPGVLAPLPADPRVVVSGNFATPRETLGALDAVLPTYRLHALNAQPGLPDREGVRLETAFVGPGMRKSPRLVYIPSRLSLVPRLFTTTCPPDVVVVHTSTPADGKVSLGIEVNILPAAIEAVRARGGIVVAQMNSPDALHVRRRRDRRRRSSTTRSRSTPSSPPPARWSSTTSVPRSATASPPASPTARPCSSASAPCPTPCCPVSPVVAACGSGRRCSATACWPSTAPARSTARPRSRRRSCSGRPSSTPGSTATRACAMLRTETTNEPSLIAASAAHDLGQHRAAGRPLRPGQRLAREGPDLLRLRRPDRLHRRGAALEGRPGDPRAALVAPAGQRLDDRAPASRSR